MAGEFLQKKFRSEEQAVNIVDLIKKLLNGENILRIQQTLSKRVLQYREAHAEAFVGSGYLKPEDKATRELEKRIKDLQEEKEIRKLLADRSVWTAAVGSTIE